jgi:predicted TIM-barrel fold metal-dependent hydrolase
MFGSNFPVDKLYRSYDELWSAYAHITSAFSKQEREKLFFDNAQQFYHIPD